MVAGCGNKCLKYSFFAINFLFFVLGGAVCGLALFIRFDNGFQTQVFSVLGANTNQNQQFGVSTTSPLQGLQLDTIYYILYAIAAIGLLIFILGFFGCCGSCMESMCVIGTYFTLVLILFVILLGGGIYVIINKGNLQQAFVNLWRTAFVTNYYTLNPTVMANVNNIQTQLACCGASGCSDFTSPPMSCNCSGVGGTYNRPGCATQIFGFIDNNLTIIIVIGAAILIIELVAMIISCCLCCAFKEKSNVNF